jgi:hypothetical protein
MATAKKASSKQGAKKQQNPWTPKEVGYFATKSDKQIAQLTGRTVSAVAAKRNYEKEKAEKPSPNISKSASKAASTSKSTSKGTTKSSSKTGKKEEGEVIILGDTRDEKMPLGTKRAIEKAQEDQSSDKITIITNNGTVIALDTSKIEAFKCDGVSIGSIDSLESALGEIRAMMAEVVG